MKNTDLNYTGDGVWHINKGAAVYIKRGLTENWKFLAETSKDLHFDTCEKDGESYLDIIFKRRFKGEYWYLRISKCDTLVVSRDKF